MWGCFGVQWLLFLFVVLMVLVVELVFCFFESVGGGVDGGAL